MKKMNKSKELMELMRGKKEMPESGDKKKKAKMDVLKELMGMAHDKAGSDMKSGMQKISIMAKDKEGLKEGLDKAEEVLEGDEMGDMMEMASDKKKKKMYDKEDEEYEEEEEDEEY